MTLLIATDVLIRWELFPGPRAIDFRDHFISSTDPDAAFGDSTINFFGGEFPGVENLSWGGSNPVTIEATIVSYYTRVPPGRVIIGTPPHMFTNTNEGMLDKHMEQFLKTGVFSTSGRLAKTLYVFNPRFRGHWWSVWRAYLAGRPIPGEQHYVVGQPPPGNRNFAEYQKGRTDEDNRIVTSRLVKDHKPDPGFEQSLSAGALRRTLSFLSDRGAKVCMVAVPMPDLLGRAMSLVPEYQALSEFLTTLAAEQGAVFLELSYKLDDDMLFNDWLHVNDTGARKYGPEIVLGCFGAS